MIHTTAAKYFDGISSRPQSLHVWCDEHTDMLHLEDADGQKWVFGDLVLQKISVDFLEVRHKHFPGKLVEIKDAAFIAQFDALLKNRGYRNWYRALIHGGFRVHMILAACILVFLVGAYFFLIPFVAEKAVDILPRSYDAMLGEKLMPSMIDNDQVDSLKTARVNAFAALHNFQAGMPLKFIVLRSKEENAYALPDGHVVIYTGILDLMTEAPELSALLAHEAAHVRHRHSMRLLCRNMAGYILISVALSDVNGIMAVIADQAHTLTSLNYSRTFEKEADLEGLKLLRENHMDTKGMPGLFKKLDAHNKNFIPAFLATHPLTKDRIEYLEKSVKGDPAKPNPELDRIFNELRKK